MLRVVAIGAALALAVAAGWFGHGVYDRQIIGSYYGEPVDTELLDDVMAAAQNAVIDVQAATCAELPERQAGEGGRVTYECAVRTPKRDHAVTVVTEDGQVVSAALDG